MDQFIHIQSQNPLSPQAGAPRQLFEPGRVIAEIARQAEHSYPLDTALSTCARQRAQGAGGNLVRAEFMLARARLLAILSRCDEVSALAPLRSAREICWILTRVGFLSYQ